jgi:hypothetical protein
MYIDCSSESRDLDQVIAGFDSVDQNQQAIVCEIVKQIRLIVSGNAHCSRTREFGNAKRHSFHDERAESIQQQPGGEVPPRAA